MIDEHLPEPDADVRLEPDWALQDPEDYIRTFQETVPSLLAETGVDPADVIGDRHRLHLVHDAADARGRDAALPARRPPPRAARVGQALEAPRSPAGGGPHQRRCGRARRALARRATAGKISSEWFFAKALQILDEAPEVYDRADRLIEAADWVVWQLTGSETRNTCTAGYKAMWSKHEGFPADAYFAALDPRFEHVIDEKMSRDDRAARRPRRRIERAGRAWTGLVPGTPSPSPTSMPTCPSRP